jgi:hypothetical protein
MFVCILDHILGYYTLFKQYITGEGGCFSLVSFFLVAKYFATRKNDTTNSAVEPVYEQPFRLYT